MYRRPKFLEVLHEIREEMSREAHYDIDLFVQMVRKGNEARDKGQGTRDEIVNVETLAIKDLSKIKK